MKIRTLFIFFLFAATIAKAQDDAVASDTTFTDEYNEQTETSEYLQDSAALASQEESAPFAVEPDVLQSTTEYKNKKIALKKFEPKKWREVVGTSNYEEEPPEPKNFDVPSGGPWSGAIFQLFAYVAIVAIVGGLLYFVVKNISVNLKIKKEQIATEDITTPVEDIEQLDTDGMLARALAEGNLKLAVRIYYLSLLQKLNATGVIAWKKDKTNRDYLSEIFLKNYYYDEVKKLTLAYEMVWYGEHALTPESFQGLIANFESVNQKINSAETS
jgi:hypothetical protein